VDLIWPLSIGVGSGISAAAGCWLMTRASARRLVITGKTAPPVEESDIAILFADGVVVDASNGATEMLSTRCLRGASYSSVRDALLPQFPTLPQSLPERSMTCPAEGETGTTAQFVPLKGHVRLSLICQPLSAGQLQRIALDNCDHVRLDTVMRSMPNPIWQTAPDGRVVWSNASFERLQRSVAQVQPGRAPFDLDRSGNGPLQRERVSLETRDGETHWYEVTTERLCSGALHFASSIDGLVAAEMAQRNFVQTLTKTFAHLPIGLAVFDRNRQLVLFNPALVDLTRLPVDFLSARPNLLSFFDHMRENRIMPEPKNYASWRDQLAEVVSAARDDRYCETWNLSSGLTYKITGRPHPDGAVAFLMEDISAEISLTRRFRSELELTQSVIDCFEDAVAVFLQLGVLTFSNAAFRELWKCDPDSAFAELTIMDATQDWQRVCEPSPIWGELRDFVLTYRDRATWDADLRMRDGRRLLCTVEPVAAGATMIRFGLCDAVRAPRSISSVSSA
jgi:PAS domain-containing protein